MRVFLLSVMLAMAAVPSWAGEPVRMLYFEREPYYFTTEAGVAGFLVERTEKLLAAAGLTAEWVPSSPPRIVETIRQGREPVCSPGWFRTDDRAATGRFTAPIHRDPPMALLVRERSPVLRHSHIDQVLADPRLRLLVKSGFSYGAQVDDKLQTARLTVLSTGAKASQLARMVAGGRADMVFVAADEGPGMLKADPALRELRLFSPAGLDQGEHRHIWCASAVDPAVVERMSRAALRLFGYSAPAAR
ncbi:MAG: transporter substrate-binding domain-containing protein [Pseudomonadota bacterium]